MPQLDKFTYFTQFFWLCLFFFTFYIFICLFFFQKNWKFVFDLIMVLSVNVLIYFLDSILGITSKSIMILGLIRESTILLLLFCPLTREKRLVFGILISTGFLLQIIILEQACGYVVFLIFVFFLGGIEFFLKKTKRLYLPLDIIYFGFLLCPHLLVDLEWAFNFYIILLLLYLFKVMSNPAFLTRKKNDFSIKSLSFFVTLLCLIGFVVFHSYFCFETDFCLKILFLISGALVFYFCFLAERGMELAIPSLSYLVLNVFIAWLITDDSIIFFHCTAIYVVVIGFIVMFLYKISLEKTESLTKIFNDQKVKILLTLLVVLDPVLSSLCFEITTKYTWVQDWLFFFKAEMGVLGLLQYYFSEPKAKEKKEGMLK